MTKVLVRAVECSSDADLGPVCCVQVIAMIKG